MQTVIEATTLFVSASYQFTIQTIHGEGYKKKKIDEH